MQHSIPCDIEYIFYIYSKWLKTYIWMNTWHFILPSNFVKLIGLVALWTCLHSRVWKKTDLGRWKSSYESLRCFSTWKFMSERVWVLLFLLRKGYKHSFPGKRKEFSAWVSMLWVILKGAVCFWVETTVNNYWYSGLHKIVLHQIIFC